jgi:hypothetical protein
VRPVPARPLNVGPLRLRGYPKRLGRQSIRHDLAGFTTNIPDTDDDERDY